MVGHREDSFFCHCGARVLSEAKFSSRQKKEKIDRMNQPTRQQEEALWLPFPVSSLLSYRFSLLLFSSGVCTSIFSRIETQRRRRESNTISLSSFYTPLRSLRPVLSVERIFIVFFLSFFALLILPYEGALGAATTTTLINLRFLAGLSTQHERHIYLL